MSIAVMMGIKKLLKVLNFFCTNGAIDLNKKYCPINAMNIKNNKCKPKLSPVNGIKAAFILIISLFS